MAKNESYEAKQFKLSGLRGISDQTLEMHFKLYEGYVKETNRLSEKIWECLKDGNVDQEEMPAYSELTRRLGFEYNGVVLHEYYFGNLSKSGSPDPEKTSRFLQSSPGRFRELRYLESRFHEHRQNARRWLGGMFPGFKARQTRQPLGDVARNRQRCGIRSRAGDGRLGARLPLRL